MKTITFAAAVVAPLIAFTQVEAADMRAPVTKAPPAASQGCAQFGGFYLGGQVGGAHYEHQFSDRNAWAGFVDDDLGGDKTNSKWGVAGGATGGWNGSRGAPSSASRRTTAGPASRLQRFMMTMLPVERIGSFYPAS